LVSKSFSELSIDWRDNGEPAGMKLDNTWHRIYLSFFLRIKANSSTQIQSPIDHADHFLTH